MDTVHEGRQNNLFDNWADWSLHVLLLKISIPIHLAGEMRGQRVLFFKLQTTYFSVAYFTLIRNTLLPTAELGSRKHTSETSHVSPDTSFLP